MKKDNPWLFQRMVRLGIVPPTCPVYVFSEQASEQVSKLNGAVNQTRIAEIAPYPHEQFAVEMWCRVNHPDYYDQKMRTLTISTMMPEEFRKFLGPGQPDTSRMVVEVESFLGATVIYPIIFSVGQGVFMELSNTSDGRYVLKKNTEYLRTVACLNADLLRKYNMKGIDADSLEGIPAYNKRAGEAVAFLSTACAVMASPVIASESGKLSGRAPPLPGARKGVERRIETKWTYVDIDLDRHAAPSADDGEAQRNGVALHPVRAHLRVTQHGISPVRAHMRGDAIYGIRHRVGVVSKSGR
jgi:hypothetical protein